MVNLIKIDIGFGEIRGKMVFKNYLLNYHFNSIKNVCFRGVKQCILKIFADSILLKIEYSNNRKRKRWLIKSSMDIIGRHQSIIQSYTNDEGFYSVVQFIVNGWNGSLIIHSAITKHEY